MDHLVGRDSELAFLAARLAEARAGRLQVVLLEGNQGVGKTALLRRFLTDLDEAETLVASGDELEQSVPFGVLTQLLGGIRAERLPAELSVATLSGTAAPAPVQIGAGLVSLAGELTAGHTALVLAIDDATCADVSSQQALAFALRRLRHDPVLIVLVAQTDGQGVFSDGLRRLLTEFGSRLRLAGLTVDDLQRLAVAQYATPMSGRAVQLLHEVTDGNPMHARALLEELSPDELQREAGPFPAPRSFRLMVLGRLANCPSETQRLVVAAAVLGRSCRVEDAARLAGVTDPLAALGPAVKAGLLVEHRRPFDAGVAFVHPLMRSAVYHDLGLDDRCALHARAAQLADDPATALTHRIEASPFTNDDLAAEVAQAAGQDAAQHRWAQAGDRLLTAARLTSDRRLREHWFTYAVDMMLHAGEVARAADHLATVPPLHDRARHHYLQGRLAMVRGDFVASDVSLRQAWAQLALAPDPPLARAVAEALTIRVDYGFYDIAAEWATRANQVAPLDADQPTALPFLTIMIYLSAGWRQQARAVFDEVTARDGGATESGGATDADGLVVGAFLRSCDDLPAARDAFSAAAAFHRRHDTAAPMGLTALYLQSLVEYQMGEWDEATTHASLATSLAADSGQVWMTASPHAAMIYPLAARGAPDISAHLARAARAQRDHTGQAELIRMARARVAHAAGDHGGVVTALSWFAGRPASDPIEPSDLPWRVLYAEALAHLGRTDAAETVLVPFEEAAAERSRRSAQLGAVRARAALELARGHMDIAAATFRQGAALGRDLPMPFEIALLDLAHGSFLRRRADGQAEAVGVLRAAGDTFARLGAAPYLARCERELAACGPSETRRPPSTWAGLLTPQELSVARLAADGLSNRQIATELVLSVRTIEYHLGNVYRKLGLRSRAHLAATRHGR
ncbi:AAA family ATPase [Frankia sp. Cas4]|uniref:AAA family ATPase n=1 Tax=Frankia sp. Cas4 TaxID=3073927 RepID=UPI002AD3146A|nr:AAA family ATPase [Frankia sp. Cas4]